MYYTPRVRNLIAILGGLALGLTGLGCSPSAEKQELDRSAIQKSLEEFLPVLGASYSSGDIESLRPYAAEKELARIQVLVSELADQGRFLQPTFKNLTIEEAHLWNHSNAVVTTLEVWDVQMFAIGDSRALSEDLDRRYRVSYQLKQDGTRWRVLYRAIQE